MFKFLYNIESGVPQGSVLGPLLFLIYINDLETNIKSNIKFFADDTMLFSIVNDPLISAIDLNHDLNVIQQWAHQWKMEFNPDPTKQATEVLFSCKKCKPFHPQLAFNGAPVKTMNEQKPLGLILDSGLSFTKHLNEKIIKAKKNIGLTKQLSKYLPLKTLNQMYKAFVRSHPDYCDIIYHIPHLKQLAPGISLNYQMEVVEKVQYQAALAVTGAWQGSNRSQLYEELGWESSSDRRMCKRVLQIYKITNNMTPSYLKDKLPSNRRPHLFSADISYTFRQKRCRSLRYMNSFFPNAVCAWNIFFGNFEIMPSIGKLKDYINSLIRPNVKSIFGIYDPVGIRFIFQLRLRLSPLRDHKWRHNFIDTTSDICHCKQGVENTDHFLLYCPSYTTQRASLIVSTNEIILTNGLNDFSHQSDFYLYGHSSLLVYLITKKFCCQR